MTGMRHAAQAAAALAVSSGVGRFVCTPILPLMTGQAGLNAEAGASLATANYLPRFVETRRGSHAPPPRLIRRPSNRTSSVSGSSRASKMRNPLSGPNGHSRRK